MGKLSWFGQHKARIWQELARQIDGDFFQGRGLKSHRVEAYYGDWMITFDNFIIDKLTYTRIRAPYVNRDDFVFRIFREHLGHRVGKVFGMKDVKVGYPNFDKHFVIQGSDERKLQMMFANPEVRELVGYQPYIYLELRREAPLFHKPPFPKGVNELYFHVPKVLKNIDQLHDLFDLFAITLDHLCAIGTAYEDDPAFRYY